jgi:hypothetical protein
MVVCLVDLHDTNMHCSSEVDKHTDERSQIELWQACGLLFLIKAILSSACQEDLRMLSGAILLASFKKGKSGRPAASLRHICNQPCLHGKPP